MNWTLCQKHSQDVEMKWLFPSRGKGTMFNSRSNANHNQVNSVYANHTFSQDIFGEGRIRNAYSLLLIIVDSLMEN